MTPPTEPLRKTPSQAGPTQISWILNPRARVWQSEGTSYMGVPPDDLFEVPDEMVEFLLLFRRPTTLAEIEEVADVDREVFDLLLESRLLIDAAREANAERSTDEVSPPASRLAMARRFAREMARVIADLFRGERLRAPRAIREGRRLECSECGWYAEGSGRGLWGGPRCLACGCHLPAKIALNSSRCPLGRW